MPREMTAAGPAAINPFCAENNQPEPMIDPVEAHSRPIRPISRLSEAGRRVGTFSRTDMVVSQGRRWTAAHVDRSSPRCGWPAHPAVAGVILQPKGWPRQL